MISFASARGNLYNRIGSIGALIKNMRSYQQTQLVAMTDTTTGAVSEFNAESDIQAIIGSAYINTLNGFGSIGSLVQNIAQQTFNRVVFRDNPRIAQNLQSLNIQASLLEVIRQMGLAGASVLRQNVTASPSGFTGTGNGIINASVSRPSDGRMQELVFAETLLFTCNSDSYIGGATLGNEGFVVTGVGSQGNLFAFDWPLGSNAQQSINAIDGNVSNGSGNLLANSGFIDWIALANVPDQFVLNVGTAGTNIYQENTIVYDGSSSSLAIVGDAPGTLTQLVQVFNDGVLGSTDELLPLKQYGFNLFICRDGLASSTGTLTVDLCDVNGITLKDASGLANSFDIDLTALSTVFASYIGQFRTPLILPSAIYLRLRLTVPLDNGRTVYVDKMSLGSMTQMYLSGPFIAVHSGSVPFTTNDYGTCVITNSRGAGGTLSTFQTLMQTLFYGNMMNSELLLPSSSVPTISDNLIA